MTSERYALDLDDLLDIVENGWKLHPLVPGKKAPATKNGFKDATTDPEQIRAWFEERSDLGWGTPTGDVADIDRPDQMELALPSSSPTQETPSGGRHVLMAPSGRRLPGKLPGDAGEWRPDGVAYVKIYDPEPFKTYRPEELPAVPEEAFASSSSTPTSDEPLSLTTREDLISLVGKLRDSGLDPDDIYPILEAMHDDGRIYDSDPDDPWTTWHFKQLATEAGKWGRGQIVPAPRVVKPNGDGQPRYMEFAQLADIEEGEPKPLLLERLHPDELTILFGDGGTGKGVLAAWWAARLVRELNLRVLVVDYEQHTRYEWRPRVRRFAGEDAEQVLAAVWVVQPDAPIWKVAPTIRAFCEQQDIDYIIVDSILYAVGDLDALDSKTAIRVTAAYQDIGLPMLALAHTTKADADPRHPFGSVFWSNSARVTMSFVGQGAGDRTLSMKKTNQKMAFHPVKYDWSWTATENEPPETLQEAEAPITKIDAFRSVVGRTWTSISDAVDMMRAAGFEVNEKSLRTMLDAHIRNHRNRGISPEVEKKTDGAIALYRSDTIGESDVLRS